MHQYDHRFATYQHDGTTRDTTYAEHRDPTYVIMPRYWVHASDTLRSAGVLLHSREWMTGIRKTARATDVRTSIVGVIPAVAVGDKIQLIHSDCSPVHFAAVTAALNSIPLDYLVRQKAGGTDLSFFILKQLPVIPPHIYTDALLAHITPRVLELTYTAWDMQPFARDLGYDGPPFVWDDDRRAHLRAELDGIYAHLYGLSRDDFAYILDTFPIVRRTDEKAYGEYRTQRLCMDAFDRFATDPAVQDARARLDRGEGLRIPAPVA